LSFETPGLRKLSPPWPDTTPDRQFESRGRRFRTAVSLPGPSQNAVPLHCSAETAKRHSNARAVSPQPKCKTGQCGCPPCVTRAPSAGACSSGLFGPPAVAGSRRERGIERRSRFASSRFAVSQPVARGLWIVARAARGRWRYAIGGAPASARRGRRERRGIPFSGCWASMVSWELSSVASSGTPSAAGSRRGRRERRARRGIPFSGCWGPRSLWPLPRWRLREALLLFFPAEDAESAED
jgi:hypothetical protein